MNNSFSSSKSTGNSKDAVSLLDILQEGCTSVVTALHRISNGQVWILEEIIQPKNKIEVAVLVWSVVERVPIHEAIKSKSSGFETYTKNYKQNIRNPVTCNINIITSNFILVRYRNRTDLSFTVEDGVIR